LNKFPEVFTGMDTEDGRFWDIAEIFNAVIQSTDEFIVLQGKIDNIGYPDHQEMIKQGIALWKKDPDVYEWIASILKLVKPY
jgi:hypothetical protein